MQLGETIRSIIIVFDFRELSNTTVYTVAITPCFHNHLHRLVDRGRFERDEVCGDLAASGCNVEFNIKHSSVSD